MTLPSTLFSHLVTSLDTYPQSDTPAFSNAPDETGSHLNNNSHPHHPKSPDESTAFITLYFGTAIILLFLILAALCYSFSFLTNPDFDQKTPENRMEEGKLYEKGPAFGHGTQVCREPSPSSCRGTSHDYGTVWRCHGSV